MYKLLREKGLNCFPVKPMSKFPDETNMPVNPETGKRGWKIYQTEKCNLPIETNYAVVAGITSNNLFILDPDTFDLYDDFKDFNTFTIKTGKGYHFYFYAKDGKLPDTIHLKNDKGQELDIRSQGAYVVGPGSIHEDKKTVYTVVNNAEIMTIDPQIIKERLVKLGFNPEARKKRMVEILKGVKEGERDMSVFRVAMGFRHAWGYNEPELLFLCRHYNQQYVFPPLPDVVVKMKVQSAMRYDIDKIRFQDVLDEANLKEMKLKYDDNFWKDVEDLRIHNNLQPKDLKLKCVICKKSVEYNPQDTIHRGHIVTVIYK